uniref:Putative membrane protein ActII-3 n=1 Tax=Talaromyces marneffei PM1 TaxID=1077442 RepID=A0A093VGL0_TALMA
MRKERQAGSLDTGIETYRSIEFNLIGDQFKEYRDLDHAGKPLQIPNFGASIEGYTSGFNLNLHDCWNPLQGSSVYHDSKTHDFFDRYSSKRPDRSHTWSGEYSDPGYGSQFGGGTTPSMSVSSFLDSRTEISSIPDDSSSYINGVAIPRQSRTKSLDDNKLRKHDARHRKAHKCEEDGCESRFGNKNDLERHRKSRNWYKERKKEEEGKKREGGIQTTSSCTADVSSRKEPPTTPTITPSTLINTLSYNPGDYFGTELGTLTLNPIGHPQNSRANAFPETLQTLNELPFSPLKADGSSADQVDFKLPSVPDILAEVNPQRRDDLVFRMGPESTPSKGENIENDMKSLMAAHFQAAMADSAAKLIGNVMRTWIPAKGHTEKGAQKKRDKNRKKESKRTATSRLEENPESLYDNGHDGGEPSTYEECPSSADETYTEAKPHSDSHGERSKARKLDHVEKHEDSVFYCCSCGDGPRPIMAMHCNAPFAKPFNAPNRRSSVNVDEIGQMANVVIMFSTIAASSMLVEPALSLAISDATYPSAMQALK